MSVLTLRNDRNQFTISVKIKNFRKKHSGYMLKVEQNYLEIKRCDSGPNTNETSSEVPKTFWIRPTRNV